MHQLLIYAGNVVSVSDSMHHDFHSNLIFPVMVSETVSLGILSLPAVVAQLGLAP